MKPKGSQEPLLTVIANKNPPSGETKAQKSQRIINEAMEIAKNNNADEIELIRAYRKAVADADAAGSPDINQQVLTTSSTGVEQTISASQSSLDDEQIRETLPASINNTVNQSETIALNPLSNVVEPGVEEVRDQSNQISTSGTTNDVMGEQVNPLLYPHSSKDKEFMNSLIPEKQNALLTAERVIGRTIMEVEAGHRPLTALRFAQHGANIIDHAHNFNVEAIVKDAMIRNQVPILTQDQMSRVDGRHDPSKALTTALMPVDQQRERQGEKIGSPQGSHDRIRHSQKESLILPKDISEYLKDFNDTFPLLLAPDAEFKVMEGQIPPPMERGSVER